VSQPLSFGFKKRRSSLRSKRVVMKRVAMKNSRAHARKVAARSAAAFHASSALLASAVPVAAAAPYNPNSYLMDQAAAASACYARPEHEFEFAFDQYGSNDC